VTVRQPASLGEDEAVGRRTGIQRRPARRTQRRFPVRLELSTRPIFDLHTQQVAEFVLEDTSFFSEFANFTKEHPYFRNKRFALVH